MSATSIKKELLHCSLNYIVTRGLILAIGFLCWSVFPERGEFEHINRRNENADFKMIWNRFDSDWYVKLASEGYPQKAFTDIAEETWGFMPLYAMLMHLVSALSNMELFYAGVFVSNVCTIFGLFLIYKLAREQFNTGADTLNLVLISCGSFYLNVVYAEGLFFLLSVAVFSLSNKKKYVLAFICAGLASVTRIQGCLLFVIPAIEILTRDFRASYKYIPGAMLGLLPMAALMWYLNATCGEPLAFIKIQKAWGSTETYPLQGFVNLFTTIGRRSSFMNAGLWLLILGAVFSQYRRLPLSYLIFTLLYFLLSTSNEIVYGTTRYMLGVIPLFLAVSISNLYVRQFFVVVNLLFLALNIATFVTNTLTFL